MKIFVIGMPQSGRTTVAEALSNQLADCLYIDATSWIRASFRPMLDKETPLHYQDEYHSWLLQRMKANPMLFVNNVEQAICAYESGSNKKFNYVIDGIFSPHDFIKLFDYNHDLVVFLNRTNNTAEYKDYENVAVPVIRDFCYWLASADLLTKNRWLEFNFAIPGNDSDIVKKLGNKNSVYIIRNIDRVAEIIKQYI